MAYSTFQRVYTWIREYGGGGSSDQRAVQDFIECETAELVRMLQHELYLLSKGEYNPETIDAIIGADRKTKYGSYEEWAKLMLNWIASYKG